MRALALMVLLVPAVPATAADLGLKRVMLSSAGVGYYEYEAALDGPGTLGLDVKLDQVDDVLKSLVVFDDAGAVGGVELPGRDASHNAFGDVPFGPEALASPLAFLNSLQGVQVVVEGPRPMTGRILHAEMVREPAAPASRDAPAPTRTRVSLLTAEGLKQFVLEDSDTVQVADTALRDRIMRALAAGRREVAQDARHVTIRSSGTGPRTVRVSYVAVAPLWKASYRLLLPAADADPATAKARLQGWATLENASDTDWSDVALSVQYGNPITFHQAIYQSYFVSRPEVPVEVLGRLLPNIDSRARRPVAAAPPPPPLPAPVTALPSGAGLAASKVAPQQEMSLASGADAAALQEGAEETTFTIAKPVNIAAGHSASVPIMDTDVPASRVSLLTQGQAHPLAALRLTNDSAASLPAGVLTLYDPHGEAPYAGDARLGGLPAGESRLVAYAQDMRTGVEWRTESSKMLASLTVSDGVLTVDERNRQATHAILTAPPASPRHVLIEVAKTPGAIVARDFAQPAEETATAWRFAADLRPGEVKDVTFAIDKIEKQTIAVLDEEDQVAAVLSLKGASDRAIVALQHVAELRSQEAVRTAERDQLAAQRAAIDADEQRLRANLAAVGAGDAIRTRLLRQLDADETRRAQLDVAVDGSEAAVAAAHRVLVGAITALRF